MPNGNNSAAMRGKLRLIRWLVACTQVPSWLMWRPVGAALATRVGPSRRRHHATPQPHAARATRRHSGPRPPAQAIARALQNEGRAVPARRAVLPDRVYSNGTRITQALSLD
jgi:hypothetical protein